MFGCSTELCSAYGLVHCSRKATSNPGSRKIPAFSIMYVNILPMPESLQFSAFEHGDRPNGRGNIERVEQMRKRPHSFG